MSILKIYPGHALQAAVQEISFPVEVTWVTVDEPEEDTMDALLKLTEATDFLSVVTRHTPTDDIDRVVVSSGTGQELVFAGAPVGTELAALVSAILITGRCDSGLSPQTKKLLSHLTCPIHIEIFTAPT